MHQSQRTDLARADAVELIKQWLPTFGLNTKDADGVLERIGTKTGILINQAQNTVVFAQFGLQEYFASLEALPSMGLDPFCKLQPRDWWREVILLTAAQQREPTGLLGKMFGEDALLAAACVAECPTPPLTLQKQAIEAALKGLDTNKEGTSSVLVPLLRKLKGEIENDFCAALEKRLQGDKMRSSVVGIALATAGTERATAGLARHPEIWDACLKNAGYLSSSFEQLLVGWIQDGDDTQSGRASELISSRLSGDRFRQMVEILASLRPNRAEKLAGLLIRHLEGRMEEDYPGPVYAEEWSLTILGRCVPFIRNREEYLLGRYHGRRSSPRRFYDDADATATALFLERKGERFTSERVQRYLLACLTWARSRGALLLWLAAGLVLMLPLLPDPYCYYGLLAPAVLLIASANRPYGSLPWMRRALWPPRSNLLMVIGVFLCGGWAVLTRGQHVYSFTENRVACLSAILMGLTLLAMGLVVNSKGRFLAWHMRRRDDLGMKCPIFRIGGGIPITLAVILLVVAIVGVFIDICPYLSIAGPTIGAVCTVWSAFFIARFGWRLRSVKQAYSRATTQLARALK